MPSIFPSPIIFALCTDPWGESATLCCLLLVGITTKPTFSNIRNSLLFRTSPPYEVNPFSDVELWLSLSEFPWNFSCCLRVPRWRMAALPALPPTHLKIPQVKGLPLEQTAKQFWLVFHVETMAHQRLVYRLLCVLFLVQDARFFVHPNERSVGSKNESCLVGVLSAFGQPLSLPGFLNFSYKISRNIQCVIPQYYSVRMMYIVKSQNPLTIPTTSSLMITQQSSSTQIQSTITSLSYQHNTSN